MECLQDQSRSFKKYVRHGEGEGVLKKPTKTSRGEGREGGQAYLYVPSVKKKLPNKRTLRRGKGVHIKQSGRNKGEGAQKLKF